MPTIKVDEEVHRELARFAGKLQVENGRGEHTKSSDKRIAKKERWTLIVTTLSI